MMRPRSRKKTKITVHNPLTRVRASPYQNPQTMPTWLSTSTVAAITMMYASDVGSMIFQPNCIT